MLRKTLLMLCALVWAWGASAGSLRPAVRGTGFSELFQGLRPAEQRRVAAFILENEKRKAPVQMAAVKDFRTLISRLADPGAKRFLLLSLSLTLSSRETVREAEAKEFDLRNAILEIMELQKSEGMLSQEGRQLFREAIVRRLNESLQRGSVKDVQLKSYIGALE